MTTADNMFELYDEDCMIEPEEEVRIEDEKGNSEGEGAEKAGLSFNIFVETKIFATLGNNTWRIPAAKDISRQKNESTKRDPRLDEDRPQTRESAARDIRHRLKASADKRSDQQEDYRFVQDRPQTSDHLSRVTKKVKSWSILGCSSRRRKDLGRKEYEILGVNLVITLERQAASNIGKRQRSRFGVSFRR